ncbi:monovalent cation/H(+) antiporter subunit G [Paenibacillus sp. CMAA1364]
MFSMIGELLIVILILIGALFCGLSAVGIVRMPDFYLRSHAATKSATLGILCVLVGTFLYFMFFLHVVSIKLLLGIAFVFITSPVAGHLNGRAAYRTGVPQWDGSVEDDLKIAFEQERVEDQRG